MLKFREEMTRSPLDKQDGLDVHASELEIKKKRIDVEMLFVISFLFV